MAPSSEHFLFKNDFDAVLNLFRSYHYGENASEAVEKIGTYEKDCHKCSMYVIVFIATAHQ